MTRIVAIVQARMGSKRLPGKMMLPLGGMPLLELVLRRTRRATTLSSVVLATTQHEHDDLLVGIAHQVGVDTFRGSETNVIARFVGAARERSADVVVRVCADNPLVSGEEIDRLVRHFQSSHADYAFNHRPAHGNGYPNGLGAEILERRTLERIAASATEPEDLEHVTWHIWRNPDRFRVEAIPAPPRIAGPDIELDVDTEEDYLRMVKLIREAPSAPEAWSAEGIVKTYRRLFPH